MVLHADLLIDENPWHVFEFIQPFLNTHADVSDTEATVQLSKVGSLRRDTRASDEVSDDRLNTDSDEEDRLLN